MKQGEVKEGKIFFSFKVVSFAHTFAELKECERVVNPSVMIWAQHGHWLAGVLPLYKAI